MATTVITNNSINVPNVLALADIVMSASHGLKVKRMMDDGSIVDGTARHFIKSPEDFSFAHDVDLRLTYLRVTLLSGFDVAWLVDDLVGDWHKGYFVLDRD